MKSTFARRISILLVLAMVLAMLPLAAMAATPTTLYLKPGPWNTANAWYSAYFFVGETNTHAEMTDTDGDGVYEVTVPEGDWTNVIFLRNDPADQVADWNGVWNQTADLAIPTDGTNMYTVTGWNAGDGAWSEYVYVEPAFYVCGTMNSWTLSYADHKMVKGDDGVYSLTLTLAAGTYEFKVNDGTWGSSWGKDGGANNIEFVLTEESNVTITFDLATKVPVVTSSAMGEVETFDYYLRGSMNEWSVSSATGMAKNDDGTYSITIDMVAGTYEYKADSGDWTDCYPVVGEPNATVTVVTDCAVTFVLDTTAGTITATGDGLGETPVDPEPVVITSAAVKGTIPGLDWDAEAATGVMELVDGIYTITIPAVAASVEGADAYAFKVVANGSWDTAYPESDWTFYLNADCDVTITFNPETLEVGLAADGLTYDAPPYGGEDPVDPPTPAGNYYVAGSMNEWTANNADYVMTAGENGIYTYTFTALAVGNYSLKVTDGTWDNSWTAAEGSEYMGSDGNLTFYVSAACDVTVTFDGSVVSVSGANVTTKAPEELVVDKVVIAGGVAGDDTADPGNMFNSQIWAVGEDITVNNLYDNEDGIYSITFSQVLAGTYAFKFVVNDNWSINYATGLEVTSGVEETAWFNALGNSTVVVTEDGSKVTFVLDLSNTVYVGDNALMTVTVEAPASIDENVAPEQIVIGDNDFAVATGNREPVTAPYTATYTGTLYIYPTAMTVINWNGELDEVPSEAINMQFGRMYGIVVDGVTVWGNQVEVVEGQTYQIGILDSMGGGCEVTLTVCSGHNFVDSTCSVCGYVCSNHNWDEGTCLICGATCAHETWENGWCINCWMQCEHTWKYTYVKNSTHTFTCSGICGCSVSIADTDGKKFAINAASPVLSDDIVMKYSTTVPAGFEEAYMVFTFNDEDSWVFEYEVATNGRYEYKFPGINPQKMGDNICATLYATIDGVQVYVQIASYSMVKNCDNQLKKSTTDAKTRTMLSDVLIYGEKAQIVTGYKTDVLVTSLLSAASTLTPSTYPDSLDASVDMQKRTGSKDSRVQFTAVTLSLGSKMAVRVAVTCTDTSLFTYKVEISGREYTYTGEDLVPVNDGSDGKYYLFFNQMKATEFGEKITFTCWEGDTQISYTIEYSVYTFIYRNMSKVDADTQELLKAIYNYGESVK